MTLCANVTCRQPFEPVRKSHLFCDENCRREEQSRFRPDGTPRRTQRDGRLRASPAPDSVWQAEAERGTCSGCHTPEVWLWREGKHVQVVEALVFLPSEVVLCGRCTQRKALGIAQLDARLTPKTTGRCAQPNECPHGHVGEFMYNKQGRRRCRRCHALRNSEWRKKRRLEVRAEKMAVAA